MTEEKEAFLDRWSRRKREEKAQEAAPPPAKKEEAPMPVLPPVEQLHPESDFKPFMDLRVDGDTRRAALKKLFADGHYNVPDPFEFYSQDFTVAETIPEEMLKTLNHAKNIFFEERKAAAEAAEAAQQEARLAEPQLAEPQPAESPQDAMRQEKRPEPSDVAGKQDA